MGIVEMDERLVSLTRDRAAELTGLSTRQVDYWQRTGLVQPAVERRLSPQRPVRLYGYVELMSLLVIVELRGRGFTLQHVRRIVERLRAEGYPQPLSQLVFATHGSEVYFQHPDGGWEGGRRPGQAIISQAIDLQVLRARIRRSTARSADSIGRSERRRGTVGYKPVVAGTRLPVDTIRRFIANGATDAQVVDAYPILELEDVEAVRREFSVA